VIRGCVDEMLKYSYYRFVVGIELILLGILFLLPSAFQAQDFPIGLKIKVDRGSYIEHNSFLFRYNNLGWVSVSYYFTSVSSTEDVQFPTNMGDVLSLYGDFDQSIGNFKPLAKFKVINISSDSVTLERIF
jgi:hypothetical protein